MPDDPPLELKLPPGHGRTRTIIQGASLASLLGCLYTLINLTWIASSTLTTVNASVEAEKMARMSDTKELSQKIDATKAMEDQKLSALTGKVVDLQTSFTDKITDVKTSIAELKATLNDIVKSSTPAKR